MLKSKVLLIGRIFRLHEDTEEFRKAIEHYAGLGSIFPNALLAIGYKDGKYDFLSLSADKKLLVSPEIESETHFNKFVSVLEDKLVYPTEDIMVFEVDRTVKEHMGINRLIDLDSITNLSLNIENDDVLNTIIDVAIREELSLSTSANIHGQTL